MARNPYEKCLERAHRVNWRIDEVLGDRRFDPDRDWLPPALSGAAAMPFLRPCEQRMMTHVEMASYAHLFGYAEEFVAPMVLELAAETNVWERGTFEALTNFAAEEVKHMAMFRQLRGRIDEQMGFPLEQLGDVEASVAQVRSKHRASVLLLTACIEWFTQRHYRECFHDDERLDPFTRHVFKCHWLEESQHAQLDTLETRRAFVRMNEEERDRAFDDLIDLVDIVDGWLQEQARADTRNFTRYTGRELGDAEREAMRTALLEAKRHTFLITGVTHPRFLELFADVAGEAQQARVNEALLARLPSLAEAERAEAA